ncbi:hypothetical protein GCM10022243_52940 [Saccharothrix violaceirubra]|uniref:Transcriptional regulator with XRE-family HTH domain n=1 Tax=Saccharothrix violaceirubra TaxID=413306 RepID=A0A7W7SZ45_9PSEU|nr:helix-turn-helix transcriptional regulator [Saccharothrix violaceirubra]MBB4963356.1 transcriptional regulator with XRE-family HTH domain [Saccharothrix violaceirubra]
MTTDESNHSSWWKFVERQLADRGLSTGDLARLAKVDRSRFTDWRRGRKISIENARSIARVFELSMLEVMVEARLITAEEAQLREIAPNAGMLPDEELVNELGRRLKHAQAARKPKP